MLCAKHTLGFTMLFRKVASGVHGKGTANGGISDRFGEFVAECFPMHSVTIINESQNTDYVSRNSSKKLSKTNRILETVSNAFPFRHC
jgi:hypothetical protein